MPIRIGFDENKVLEVFNTVFRHKAVPLGVCDWGYIEVLCWGHQVKEFKDHLSNARQDTFFRYAVEIRKLDVWPRYPFNATGDENLTGLDSGVSLPIEIAEQKQELATLKRKVEAMQKTYHLLTGEPVK